MSAKVTCGCGAAFRARGILSHIRQSSNPKCKEATRPKSVKNGKKSKKTRTHVDSPGPCNTTDEDKDASDDPPLPQADSMMDIDPHGDYFGNYDSYLHEDNEPTESATSDTNLETTDNKSADDSEDEDQEAYEAEFVTQKSVLEPERPAKVDIAGHQGQSATVDATSGDVSAAAMRLRGGAEEGLRKEPFVVPFPHGEAGKIYEMNGKDENTQYGIRLGDPLGNMYHPFISQIDWEIARWAKLRGPSSTALTELLNVAGVKELLGLSFSNANELNKILDTSLPGRPRFKREEILVGDEVCEVFFRDVLECIKALFGDPDFAPYLAFVPERHYTNASMDVRLYHDMKTGRWWWATQKEVEKDKPGATIIPLIISTDKTQLTLFRNKHAYPIYLTIGNIPKELRRRPSKRAYILLGYLPTTKLEGVTNQASKRRQLGNLYHSCMKRILQPLEEAGREGLFMQSGDGCTRRVHPIFACFVGDYPEQVLTTCTYTGQCPACPTPHDEFENYIEDLTFRDLEPIIEALDSFEEDPSGFLKTCEAAGVKPVVKPFWIDLPYANIYQSITPDVLHQLYQGLVKHVVGWITAAGGAAEIDARCRRMPPNHNIRHFVKGISSLSRVSGKEHDQMCRILLGLVIDLELPNGLSNARLLKSVRALLDFLHLAQLPVHTDETLALLDDALQRFHENKAIFVDLAIRENFNLPKLHYALHYAKLIKLFGTTDNVNTEYTERLHIDLAKDAYDATNHKDEFAQMTVWLERKEKVLRHDQFIKWHMEGSPLPPLNHAHIDTLIQDYGATHFRNALARFIVLTNNPDIHRAALERMIWGVRLPFVRLPVWHRVKFLRNDPVTRKALTADTIHVRPAKGKLPARFDTAWINEGDGEDVGVDGYAVGRIRVVFSIPEGARQRLFRQPTETPQHLAYVQWFSPLKDLADPHHLLYSISPLRDADGAHVASIVALDDIRRSVHLFPKFGRAVPQEWTSNNVLDLCNTFFVNSFTDKHFYRIAWA